MSTQINETLFVAYFVVCFVLALGTVLFFMGRDPAFKKRWHRRVYVFNAAIVGGMLLVMTIPNWPATVVFTLALLFLIWIIAFRTRVCSGCGKICQPRNLITPDEFCSKCGTTLE